MWMAIAHHCVFNADSVYALLSSMWGAIVPWYHSSCWQYLFWALQNVSSCSILLCFCFLKVTVCSWLRMCVVVKSCYVSISNCVCFDLFRKWVAAMLHHVSGLLIIPVYCLVCKWLQWFAIFLAYNTCSWCSSLAQWVVAVPHCISSLLTNTVLGYPVCEWLSCLAIKISHWHFWSSPFRM